MSDRSQKGATTMIAAIIIPKGLTKIASIIFPCPSKMIARVEPQEGQGIPVIFLNKQIETEFSLIK